MASSDEGEITENRTKLRAAPSAKPAGTGVDRRDRMLHDDRSGRAGGRHAASGQRLSRSPDRRSDYASDHSRHNGGRSPPPPPRGYKRSRDDRDGRDYYHRGSRGRGYIDSDRPSRSGLVGGSDRGGRGGRRDYGRHQRDGPHQDKRQRYRSRSPYPRDRHAGGRFEDRSSKATMYDDQNDGDADGSQRGPAVDSFRSQARDAKHSQGSFGDVDMIEASQAEPAKPPAPEEDEEPVVIDEDAEIERRRRRRQEILAKSSSATPLLIHALHSADRSAPSHGQNPPTPDSGTPVPDSGGSPGSPEALDLGKEGAGAQARTADEDGPSAADYDPTADMKEDERRDELRHGNFGLHGHSVTAAEGRAQARALQGQAPVDGSKDGSDGENDDDGGGDDDDDDDDFDMFAENLDEDRLQAAGAAKGSDAADGGILEGQDKDGYYKIRPGDVIGGRYQIQATLGKGMFASVVRAVDVRTKQLVAVKMMRNNDALRKGGYTEIAILEKLNEADPDDRKHIVRFERHFDHKGHLCLAFENLSMNLREVLRKFGNNVGINLTATRAYAYQIFVALAHMRRCSIIHADLKPDNILINEGRNVLKLCDLGTAIDRSDAATAHNEVMSYLVSRFYRAPEIILGIPFDYGIDTWSIGCTLYELYTGKILFTGDSNNQMLKAIMEVRGRLPPKLYRRGQLSDRHFDSMGNFLSMERDKFGKTIIKTLPVVKPSRDLRARLTSIGIGDAEARDLNNFTDLLESCLTLNPEKRIKPADALKHPFFTTKRK